MQKIYWIRLSGWKTVSSSNI